ncbi:protein FAM83A [Limanda limanda]|uniref:protein FAM83A n=1 Tax=Limanda limanda TaxID=27771 RepID=UPI0029C65967|nr:protein FAM83A [Limanda limanda]
MDTSSVSALWYRRSKPQGKVRRRVQDLRIPSSCYSDFIAVRPVLDLSHSESVRLAVDSLLSLGLQGYHKVLNAEGEADFLSELEKDYILRNGKEGNAASPGESDGDDDTVLEGLSTGSQSATQCPAVATGRGPGYGQSSVRAGVRDEPNAEVYFQSDGRGGAGMKDLVREFIRKATLALAIVMDSFTDVELLCDLLEASRKRNVSVHLLLDHLSLNLFVTMWQDLKLNSKDFPKLSVRSIDGQTYCSKTGRKLTGQVAESFIITDWTEALTGSYSFSWLSWQVHRSLAVLVKGSEVTPFHQEFHRLYSSSKPILGLKEGWSVSVLSCDPTGTRTCDNLVSSTAASTGSAPGIQPGVSSGGTQELRTVLRVNTLLSSAASVSVSSAASGGGGRETASDTEPRADLDQQEPKR